MTGPLRWTARRKAQIVEEVRRGQMPRDEALALYSVSLEEFESWERAFERYGVPGLRATRLQVYRETEPGAVKPAKPRRHACCNHS